MQDIVFEDFCKIADIVMKFSSMYPEQPNIWSGSVSSRVQMMLDKIVELQRKNEEFSG
jgi:hypothetical protein